jgi:hypothetical protein
MSTPRALGALLMSSGAGLVAGSATTSTTAGTRVLGSAT